MKGKGKFIVFEGLDGCGKTTQAELLERFLLKKGIETVMTCEPTKGRIYSPPTLEIAEILNGRKIVAPIELQKLFVADRKIHLENFVLPWLARSAWVISDRYFYSTLAFGSLDLELDLLREMNKSFPAPDMAFFIDLSAKICVERIVARSKPVEFFEKKEKLEKVAKAYNAILKKYPELIAINGNRRPEEISEEVISMISEKFFKGDRG